MDDQLPMEAMKGGVDLFTLYNPSENDKSYLDLPTNTDSVTTQTTSD